MWYREDIARTSGETNFSGVHKDSLAACGPGARVLASPSRTSSKSRAAQGLARANSRAFHAQKLIKIKIASGNKNISSPIQQGEVSSL